MKEENHTPIDAYELDCFSFKMRNGHVATHPTYTLGSGDKVVLIIQELPGIVPQTLMLADKFVANGYTVVLPHLFGEIGEKAVFSNLFRVFCMRKEFNIFAKNESSPIVDFLSALCTKLKDQYQVKGIGVIGMCLTGNFAISLMANDAVLAGFASQPSLPVFSQRSLHMNLQEISKVKKRLDEIGPMHCGRFKGDILCTAKKFKALDKTFNRDGKERIIFHELPGKGHAILTIDFYDKCGKPKEAPQKTFLEILSYFDDQLAIGDE